MANIYECPWCFGTVEIIEFNCKIFRHAVYKKDTKQLEPHASKEVCEKALQDGLIWGCGKPFQIINDKIIKCDYI